MAATKKEKFTVRHPIRLDGKLQPIGTPLTVDPKELEGVMHCVVDGHPVPTEAEEPEPGKEPEKEPDPNKEKAPDPNANKEPDPNAGSGDGGQAGNK